MLLPNDVSQYLQDSEPLDTAVVTLSQFAHVVKLQSHAERKATECRTRLHRALVLDGLTLRLLRCGESTRNTLFDYCRQEDRTATVQLAARFRELKDQTTAVRSILSQETPAVSDSRLLNISLRGDSASFLDGLPDESRSVFLEFLTTIRTKPGFLADRICDLPQDLLIDLVKHHEIPLPTESILSYQPQKPRPSRKTPSADGPENGGIDRLNDFSRHDPLSLLLHTVFLTGARQGTTEARLRTDVWAEVCAKLFIEGRGEKVIYAALDSWAAARPWSARANLELYMMKMIKRGTFLLDSKQSSIAMTQNPYNRKQDIMKEEFIDEGVEGLFDVLDDQPDASGIPEGAIELGHAIIDKLQDPTRKKAATVLILGKWFFNRFLTSILMYPEVSDVLGTSRCLTGVLTSCQRHGLLLNHYLPEFARLRIFRDIIVKVSKDVTTVLQRL